MPAGKGNLENVRVFETFPKKYYLPRVLELVSATFMCFHKKTNNVYHYHGTKNFILVLSVHYLSAKQDPTVYGPVVKLSEESSAFGRQPVLMTPTRSSEAPREADHDGHIVIHGTVENTIKEQMPVQDEEEQGTTSSGEGEILQEGEGRPLLSEQRSDENVQSLEVVHQEIEIDERPGRDDHGSSLFDGAKSAWQSFKSKFFSSSGNNDASPSEEQHDIEQGSSGPSFQGSRVEASPGAVCLICLDPLLPEDFASGKAMSLECGCRGDLALRHRDCAIKWSQVKDDGRGGLPVCELCKKPVQNLPELPARPQEETEDDLGITIEEAYFSDPSQFQQFVPSRADIVFDCIRVTWIAMIISILFFNANIEVALWTGLVAGAAYIVMLRLLYKQHFEALQAYAQQHAVVAGQRIHHLEVQTV